MRCRMTALRGYRSRHTARVLAGCHTSSITFSLKSPGSFQDLKCKTFAKKKLFSMPLVYCCSLKNCNNLHLPQIQAISLWWRWGRGLGPVGAHIFCSVLIIGNRLVWSKLWLHCLLCLSCTNHLLANLIDSIIGCRIIGMQTKWSNIQ